MRRTLTALLTATGAWLFLAAQTVRAEDPTGPALYDKTLRCTCWVRAGHSRGTGSLVNKAGKLVLTAAHVVGTAKTANIYFPVFDDKGKPVVDKGQFEKMAHPVAGTVILRDPAHDLALIRLNSVPDGVNELKIAEKSAAPGDRLHSVGCGETVGCMFGYHTGFVSQRCQRTDGYAGVKTIDCWVLETQVPHNPGDSGGPSVNDQGELVCITASYVSLAAAQVVSFHIDVAEIREFLKKAP